jgi:hypothetical protein
VISDVFICISFPIIKPKQRLFTSPIADLKTDLDGSVFDSNHQCLTSSSA